MNTRPPQGWVICLSLSLVWAWLGPTPVFAQTARPPLTIERIELEGNSKTKPDVIYRYLSLAPGDTVNPARIEANQRRLEQTNFFKEVEFYARPGSEKGKVILVVEVKERKWPYFQFEGGHSDLDGWFFVPASLRFDNLFGRGNRFGVGLVLGDRITRLGFAFRDENIFDDTAFWELELAGKNQDFVHYLGSERAQQRVEFGGLRFRLGGTRGFFKHVNFAYRLETYEPRLTLDFIDRDSTATQLPPVLAADTLKTQIGAFAVTLPLDLRDNPAYPMRGLWGALSFDLAHRQLGSDRDFGKVTLDARLYRKLAGRQVLALHLKGGFAGPSTPFYQRFYLGGANSLRGYPFQRLTPLGGATKLFLSNLEWRFPLTQTDFPYHKLSGVLFFDAGGSWKPGQTPRAKDLYYAAGFGFRYKLPVLGVTRFDFAFPLKRVDDNDFQFHISLGHTF